MKKIAMIPARYASTRFPYKLMQRLGDKTVIRHTHDNVKSTGLFDEVFVVTDHEIIFNEVVLNNGKAIMSKKEHESGSDRIAEAVRDMDADVILNVQGDEPFVSSAALGALVKVFEGTSGRDVKVASLMKKMTDEALINDPNYVKVVTGLNNDALFFSRSPIPYHRDKEVILDYFEHIGVYAFRKEALLEFTTWPPGLLEQCEKLEQLRYLENGIPVRMVITDTSSVKIDVPADLLLAEQYLATLNS